MKKPIALTLLSLAALSTADQGASDGRLYIHAGYYSTILNGDDDKSTAFQKYGITYYFGNFNRRRSEFFTSASDLRGLNRGYEDRNAGFVEFGSLYRPGKGFEIRSGSGLLFADGRKTLFNTTIGLSYSIPMH